MSAAEHLSGMNLKNGWHVVKPLSRSHVSTGGFFSHSYLVERQSSAGGTNPKQVGFLKAFDFSDAFKDGANTIQHLQYLTSAFENERAILDHIRDKRLSHATIAIEHGDVQVPEFGTMEGRVFYLIFEMADGDIRVQMDASTACDVLWCLQALRDVTLGLWQVHREFIAHQDTKPSNVLVYPGPTFRLADFGRSSRRGHPAPHDDFKIPGDRSYAAPELMYGYIDPDFAKRRLAPDLYMLGNVAGFLFSGVNVMAEVMSRLDPAHHPTNWTGTYSEVLPYVRQAFSEVLIELRGQIDKPVRDGVLSIVSELCEPDVSRRGHPRSVGKPNQFSLERYVSQMTLMVQNLQVHMRIARKSA